MSTVAVTGNSSVWETKTAELEEGPPTRASALEREQRERLVSVALAPRTTLGLACPGPRVCALVFVVAPHWAEFEIFNTCLDQDHVFFCTTTSLFQTF